jgi:hypothetical protein
MPTSYNIRSFKSVRQAHGVGLLAKCYLACVYLELCLKSVPPLIQHAGTSGHDLPAMLCMLATSQASPATVRTARALAAMLGTKLSRLHCMGRGQQPALVPSGNYPHMRYLRHDSDWPGTTQSSSDTDLKGLLYLLDQIFLTLRQPNSSLPL